MREDMLHFFSRNHAPQYCSSNVIGQQDTLKVIDQGADDTTSAMSIRRSFARTAGVVTTEETAADLIQMRHRIPETLLRNSQILIYQMPIPELLRFIELRDSETIKMHVLREYGAIQVKLYEDVARSGHIDISYDYPVMVSRRFQASRRGSG